MRMPIWVCSHDYGGEGRLVVARDGEEARRLYVAVTGHDLEHINVGRAEWFPGKDAVVPEDKMVGIWLPPDDVLAAYGFIPSDDWSMCSCCGLILLTERNWTKHENQDECDTCIEAACREPK